MGKDQWNSTLVFNAKSNVYKKKIATIEGLGTNPHKKIEYLPALC